MLAEIDLCGYESDQNIHPEQTFENVDDYGSEVGRERVSCAIQTSIIVLYRTVLEENTCLALMGISLRRPFGLEPMS